MNPSATKDTTLKQLSYLVLGLVILLGIGSVLLFYLNRFTPVPASWGTDDGARNNLEQWISIVAGSLVIPIVSGLLAVLILGRHPRQKVAWLLISFAFIATLTNTMGGWAIYSYYTSASAVGGAVSAWIGNWLWVGIMALIFLALMIFPNGRFLSRPLQLIGVSLLCLFTVPMVLGGMIEDPLGSAYQIPNPFISLPERFAGFLNTLGPIFTAPLFLFVLLTVLLRYLKSAGREKQQMKWLLLGAALMVIQLLLGFSLVNPPFKVIGDLLINNAYIWPILGVGIALLRHNLYGVDLIIRRTLIYGVLTVILIGIYLSGVILLQRGFRAITGQESQLAVVLSTLIIAALFSPLRRRIQQLIDKRFYRSSYDAQKVLAAFALKARDEVELDALTSELLSVVKTTMQPAHMSLWLKKD